MLYLTSINSLSLPLQVLFFRAYSISDLLVAKIGMSVKMQTSQANWFLGDGSFTFSPSRRSSKSFQHINSLLHPRFGRTITSAWSAPTQAYLWFTGLINAWKMISSGFNRNTTICWPNYHYFAEIISSTC